MKDEKLKSEKVFDHSNRMMTSFVKENATPEELAMLDPPASLSIAELYQKLNQPVEQSTQNSSDTQPVDNDFDGTPHEVKELVEKFGTLGPNQIRYQIYRRVVEAGDTVEGILSRYKDVCPSLTLEYIPFAVKAEKIILRGEEVKIELLSPIYKTEENPSCTTEPVEEQENH